MFSTVQKYSKFLVAILAVVVSAGVGLLPADYIAWVQFAVAIIGAVGVYAVPNAPAAATPSA